MGGSPTHSRKREENADLDSATCAASSWTVQGCSGRLWICSIAAAIAESRATPPFPFDASRSAEAFLDAWTHQQFGRARALLRDDVAFEGPFERFDNADAYVASLRQLSGIVKGAEPRRVFVDGEEACVIYDLHTEVTPTSRVCEWFRVRDDRIASVSVVFDPRPFARMFHA